MLFYFLFTIKNNKKYQCYKITVYPLKSSSCFVQIYKVYQNSFHSVDVFSKLCYNPKYQRKIVGRYIVCTDRIQERKYFKMKAAKRIAGIALAMAMSCSTLTSLAASAADYSAANVEAYTASSDSASKGYLLQDIVESSGYKTNYTTRYAYKKLSASEKKLYKLIVEAARNLNAAVEIPSGLTSDQVLKVYTLVFHEEPQLFWLGENCSTGSEYMFINYKTTDTDEIKQMQDKMNKNIKSLMTKAKKQSTTYGKLKVFYDWLILNNDFELSAEKYNATIYGGFVKGEKLQCAGYAKTMQYLCDLAGIKSMVVTGTNDEGSSHAWNIVYCGNGWYNLDATWGDPINDYDSSYLQYEFFLVPDKWIHDYTHFNINKITRSNGTVIKLFTPPTCTKTTYNYFIKNKMNYTSASSALNALKKQIKTAVKNGDTVVEIRVSSKAIYDKMTGSYATTLNKYAKSCSSKVKSVSKHTKYTQGSYVVHYDINYKK